jgi:hypothetical protein
MAGTTNAVTCTWRQSLSNRYKRGFDSCVQTASYSPLPLTCFSSLTYYHNEGTTPADFYDDGQLTCFMQFSALRSFVVLALIGAAAAGVAAPLEARAVSVTDNV